ncbi:SMP-30/gluconolactonase/LRE family protein [Cupriavidus basilensis]
MARRELSVLTEGHTFLEGPRWHEGRLWLSDFYTHRVMAVSLDGTVEPIAEVPQQPSGLGWLPDGRLLIVSMRDRKLLRREADGSLSVHADLSAVASGHVNDMVVDQHGRAYVGNFGFDLMAGAPMRTASLARVDPDGTVTVVADGLFFPNGSVITPDGKSLVVGETLGNRISAFDLHADGSLGPAATGRCSAASLPAPSWLRCWAAPRSRRMAARRTRKARCGWPTLSVIVYCG